MTSLSDALLTVLPIALLMGAWAFFMWKMRGQGVNNYANIQRRQVEALERIASALERRPL
jgi:hypothetical protein